MFRESARVVVGRCASTGGYVHGVVLTHVCVHPGEAVHVLLVCIRARPIFLRYALLRGKFTLLHTTLGMVWFCA